MVLQIAGILLRYGDKVLLQLRDNKTEISSPNKWTIPGGAFERGELPEIAAKRELKEETGYNSEDCKLLAEFKYKVDGIEKFFWVFTEDYDQKQKIQCFEGQRMEWVNLDDIEKIDLIPVARRALRKFKKIQVSG